MKTNIEQLRKKAKEQKKRMDSLRSSKIEYSKQIEKLKNEAQTAAEAGEITRFKQLRSNQVDLESELFVIEQQLRKVEEGMDPDEVHEAWKAYHASYSKDMEKLLATFDANLSRVADAFMDLVHKQNEALKIREECGSYLNLKIDPERPYRDPYEELGMYFLDATADLKVKPQRMGTVPQKIQYYFAADEVPQGENDLINQVIWLHKHHE